MASVACTRLGAQVREQRGERSGLRDDSPASGLGAWRCPLDLRS